MTGSSEVKDPSKPRSRDVLIDSVVVVSHSTEPGAADLISARRWRESAAMGIYVVTRCGRHGDYP